MKPEIKIDADKIHILDIKTLKGNIECLDQSDVKKVSGHQFNFTLNTGLASGSKMVGIKLIADIKAVDKEDQVLSITGSYTHEMVFRVENLEDFLRLENGAEKIDAGLGSTLVSIIYSTVRGIIYSRTQSTSLGVVILPVIAPLKLMGLQKEVAEKEKLVRAKQIKNKM